MPLAMFYTSPFFFAFSPLPWCKARHCCPTVSCPVAKDYLRAVSNNNKNTVLLEMVKKELKNTQAYKTGLCLQSPVYLFIQYFVSHRLMNPIYVMLLGVFSVSTENIFPQNLKNRPVFHFDKNYFFSPKIY